MATKLPKGYEWLYDEPGPNMLRKAIELYGTVEYAKGSNPVITGWAEEVGINTAKNRPYSDDDIPWCGLFMAVCAKRAGWNAAPGGNALWARNWASWENPAPGAIPMLGDVLVFSRGSGGHVAQYVGEDAQYWHILGGNQSNAVTIMRKPKRKSGDGALIAVRRPKWKIAQPPNVRRAVLTTSGAPIGGSEA